jgi:AraC-like DNA-binding protein
MIAVSSSMTPAGHGPTQRRLLGGRTLYADGVPLPDPFCLLLVSVLGDLSLWLGRACAASLALPLERVPLEAIARLDDGTLFLVDRRRQVDDPRVAALTRILIEPTVRHLAASLVTALDDPLMADAVFVERAALAFDAHLSSRLTFSRAPCMERGGLARWQQERASELLLRHPSRSVPLNELADVCRLSVSHFVRAFRKSTGLPPHRWLVVRRVNLCKDLLVADRRRPLADIALACGFADQSHFTRTFSRIAGMTPGAWRRHALA